MNINVASQNHGIIAWDGTAGANINIANHVYFSFTFQVTADLAADAVFKFQSAPNSDVDPCLPGTFAPVKEILTCSAPWGSVADEDASIVIPAGTKAWQICTATLPCKPNPWIKLVGTGAANVKAVAVLSGPK